MLAGNHKQNYDINMQRVVGFPDDPSNQEDFYGAQLSLIYYRALTDEAQTLFRNRVKEGYSTRSSGPSGQNKTRYYRRIDAHFSLAFGAMSINPAFTGTNSGPVRHEGEFLKEGMLMQPWCLSDSEFQAARVVIRDGNIPNLGGGSSEGEKARDAIVKSELMKVISDWLKSGIKGSGIASTILRAPLRSSALGAFVSLVQDLLKSAQLQSYREAFDKDEPRRLWLASVGWGDYVAPAAVTIPTLPSFVGGVPSAPR